MRTLSVSFAMCCGVALSAATFQTPPAGKPDDSRFTPVMLIAGGELDEPMMLAVLPDERVLVIERKGGFKVYDPITRTTTLIAKIPVNTKYYSPAGRVTEAEEGLFGLTLDPRFTDNRWIYLRYADPDVPKHVLARWELQESQTTDGRRSLALVESSKRIVLEHPAQRERCCHTGGGMAWDRQGNLYLTVGNNTGGGMTDERPGMATSDDQRSSANTNDLRGKILRIHPEPDGTYTIPPGNLFPPGAPNTRPEIYTMGHRNPWRVSIDSRTGFIYWGEVGPSDGRANGGPIPYDEFNQARGPGFFGFPYFVGENEGFGVRDFVNGRLLPPKDPSKPTNLSVNNTGLRELPPAQPAFIAYSYEVSEKYPELGSGAHSATGGPIYHRADFAPTAKRPFPGYYEGKWLAADLERGWIMAITMDASSRYVSMEPFLPSYHALEIIDLQFGAEGDLYVLDYGSTWFGKSTDSNLVKIEYTAGNRKPKAAISASTLGGTPPFEVSLSAADSKDPDNDPLKYQWKVTPPSGPARLFSQAAVKTALTRPGVYQVQLVVADAAGATDTASLDVISGNAPPVVSVNVSALNRSFFKPGAPLDYTVSVSDHEDGIVAPDSVAVSIDYVPGGVDLAALGHGREPVDATTRFALAKALIASSDCAGCHNREGQSFGPSFAMLTAKYRPDPATLDMLAKKVRSGGSKVWGDNEMPAHPGLSAYEVQSIVRYMLSANDRTLTELPLQGRHTPLLPPGETGHGALVVRAVYTDKAAPNLPAQTAEAMAVLRTPNLAPAAADVLKNATFGSRTSGEGSATRNVAVTVTQGGVIGFRHLDLTGITAVQLAVSTAGDMFAVGGDIEVRTGSPTGDLLGRATIAEPPPRGRGRGAGATPVYRATNEGVIALKPTPGFQDVYFVFTNPRATAAQPLMTVAAIKFISE